MDSQVSLQVKNHEAGDKRTGKGGKQKRKGWEARGLRSRNHLLSDKILSRARTLSFLSLIVSLILRLLDLRKMKIHP